MRAIAQAVDDNGLVGFWPHTRGLVTLTAWSYELMVRAEAAHLPVDAALRDRLATVLTQSLRSDYPHLLSDAALLERATALYALAAGGKLDAAYASELARTAGALNTSGLAMVVSAIAATPNADRALIAGLLETLWSRVHILARNGTPAYAGLADFGANPLILPSETRSLAEVTRAVALATPEEPKLALLRSGLVGLGGSDGWGNTNADAAALRALSAGWDVAQRRPAGDRHAAGRPETGHAGSRHADGKLDHAAAGSDARGQWRHPAAAGAATTVLCAGPARCAGDPGAAGLRAHPCAAARAWGQRADGSGLLRT